LRINTETEVTIKALSRIAINQIISYGNIKCLACQY
jgi:hypothetical protein